MLKSMVDFLECGAFKRLPLPALAHQLIYLRGAAGGTFHSEKQSRYILLLCLAINLLKKSKLLLIFLKAFRLDQIFPQVSRKVVNLSMGKKAPSLFNHNQNTLKCFFFRGE